MHRILPTRISLERDVEGAQGDVVGNGILVSSRFAALSRRADLEAVCRDDGKSSFPDASGVSQDSSSSLSLELMVIFSTAFFVVSLGSVAKKLKNVEKKKAHKTINQSEQKKKPEKKETLNVLRMRNNSSWRKTIKKKRMPR